MCGSSPLADAVTRSDRNRLLIAGIGITQGLHSALSLHPSMPDWLAPRFEPLEPVGLLGIGLVAEGRLQKYLGSENDCPMRLEPIGLPSFMIMLPLALAGMITWETPVTTSG